MQPTLLILASVLLGVVGQLALKSGVSRLGPLGLGHERLPSLVRAISTRPGVVGGLALYGLSMFCWLMALSRVELSYAYPFISLSYVLVLLASATLFKEQVSPLRILGVAAICLGIYVAAG